VLLKNIVSLILQTIALTKNLNDEELFVSRILRFFYSLSNFHWRSLNKLSSNNYQFFYAAYFVF